MRAREQRPDDRGQFARSLRLFGRDRRGSALIEFGFVALPLFGLLVAILQTSLTFFAQQTLESTAEKTVRQLMTGNAQKSGLDQAGFRTAVCAELPEFMKCSNVFVDVQVATGGFSTANTAPPTLTFDSKGANNNKWQYKPGGPGEITVVRIMYLWNVQKGPLGFDLSTLSAGRRLLVATAVFKTEPFTS